MLFSYSYSYAEATSIAACCHFWGYADPWIFSIFQHRDWVENRIVPFEISIASSLCWASFCSTVWSTQENKSSQLQVAPSCVHLVVNKCLNPICIYHSPRSAWPLCWSCELVGSRVVYSSVIRSSLRAPVQVWELLKTGVTNTIQCSCLHKGIVSRAVCL
jgi:hypothetical protein